MVSTRVHKTGFELSQDESIDAWEFVIRHLYTQEDDVWFKRYHKSGGNMETAIADTLSTISPNAEFYTITQDDEVAGFFVKTQHQGKLVLEGFHIHKAFRQAAFFQRFWTEVKKVFGEEFYTGIYAENTPAIKHLSENGFVEIGTMKVDGKRFTLLKNKLI